MADAKPSGPRPEIPPSAGSMAINLFGLAYFLWIVFCLRRFPTLDIVVASVIAMASLAVPILGLEAIFLKSFRLPTTGLSFPAGGTANWKRVGVKLAGFYGTLGAVALAYWVFSEYQGLFYQRFWRLLRLGLPWVLALAPAYFPWVDRRMREPEDGFFQAGLAILGQWKRVDRGKLGQHALGWIVKGFYLPLMFVYLTNNVQYFRSGDFTALFSSFKNVFDFFFQGALLMDLGFVSCGYLLTFRVLDTHIRSTEPTLLGWTAALICYEPFWDFFYVHYLTYDDGLQWGAWLWDHPVAYTAWGSAILVLIGIFALSSASFGMRFSNLTHRGILTHGPYRFSKHPAYVSKNISWWLISIPFLSNAGGADAIRHCLILLLLNGVYYLRARTEERHLSRDPVYVAYALAMNERGVLRLLGRLFPWARYRPPAGRQA